MGDLLRLAVEFDVHDGQRIEGDRAAGGFFADQRDDGARKPFAFAGEDAVGEAAGRQRLAGNGAQIRDQRVEIGLRQRQPRTFDDARLQAGMGAQSEIDVFLRKRLEPERGMTGQAPAAARTCPRLWRIAELPLQKDVMPLARTMSKNCARSTLREP